MFLKIEKKEKITDNQQVPRTISGHWTRCKFRSSSKRSFKTFWHVQVTYGNHWVYLGM